jgi:murein DD-endopeptidase MepM/ murein hydrolase activator NlpD
LSTVLLLATFIAAQSPVPSAPPAPEVGVPFGCGLKFPVSQAHAVGSHLHNDTFAWDFKMPEGIPIVAAGDGWVRMARGDSRVGGCDPRFAADSNYVVIAHPNGLETQYLHFERVVVKAGDTVKKGDLIGFSGKTGWACGSHLHFKVARPVGNGWNNPSVTARLAGHGDPNTGAWIAAPACPPEKLPIVEAPRPPKSEGLGGSQM